jgi:hypothetical protein
MDCDRSSEPTRNIPRKVITDEHPARLGISVRLSTVFLICVAGCAPTEDLLVPAYPESVDGPPHRAISAQDEDGGWHRIQLWGVCARRPWDCSMP